MSNPRTFEPCLLAPKYAGAVPISCSCGRLCTKRYVEPVLKYARPAPRAARHSTGWTNVSPLVIYVPRLAGKWPLNGQA
ncbi:hypothetical protein I2750_00940 [Bacillus sp. PR5]|nr:hypothetical protein [Bacillus sp. PR5]